MNYGVIDVSLAVLAHFASIAFAFRELAGAAMADGIGPITLNRNPIRMALTKYPTNFWRFMRAVRFIEANPFRSCSRDL